MQARIYRWSPKDGRHVGPDRLPDFRAGDLLGFTDPSCLSIGIELATFTCPGRGLSHIATVGEHPEGGPLVLYESEVHPAHCVVRHRAIAGFHAAGIRRRIQEHPGAVWWLPLATPLNTVESARLTIAAVQLIGTRYDLPGAFHARDACLGWLWRLLHTHEDLHRVFCSEATAHLLRSAGRFDTANASRWSPNRLANALEAAGVVRKRVLVKPCKWSSRS